MKKRWQVWYVENVNYNKYEHLLSLFFLNNVGHLFKMRKIDVSKLFPIHLVRKQLLGKGMNWYDIYILCLFFYTNLKNQN